MHRHHILLALVSWLLLPGCGKKGPLVQGRFVEHSLPPLGVMVGENEFTIFSSRENHNSAVCFKNSEIPMLLDLLPKYKQLIEVSKSQRLASGVTRELGSMAYCKVSFTTPNRLVFDAKYFNDLTRPEHYSRIKSYPRSFLPAECEQLPEVLKRVPQWREEDAAARQKQVDEKKRTQKALEDAL